MSPPAHVSGLPLEESIIQLAPAALAAVVAVRLSAERTLRWAKARAARAAIWRRRAGRASRGDSR